MKEIPTILHIQAAEAALNIDDELLLEDPVDKENNEEENDKEEKN
jgi:hypothetical protein